MTNMQVRLPFALHNLERYDTQTQRRASIRAAVGRMKGGFGGLNEIHSNDVRYLENHAAMYGLKVYRYLTNAILYTPSIMKVDFKRAKLVAKGGAIGPKGQKVGPNRYMLQMGFTILPILFPFQVALTHLPHQAFTSKKWKQPIYWGSVKTGGTVIAEGLDTHPNGVGMGDLNNPEFVNWPTVPDIIVPTPPTYGNKHYDQVAKFGDVVAVNIEEFYTPSDHDGIEGVVILNVKVVPRPVKPRKVSLPKPGANVRWRRYGAPVDHPWAGKTKRWQRRHPVLWRRIKKWRATYLRKLK